MGPQSSGKSTLLNHLFGTKFREMDAMAYRGQTTQARRSAQGLQRTPAAAAPAPLSRAAAAPREADAAALQGVWLAQSCKGSEGVRTLVLDLEVRPRLALRTPHASPGRARDRVGRSDRERSAWCRRVAPCGAQGTDGRERGEDDTAFEKQTALFAMASADVMLVNMWCHDIGREHGAGKPLLKTARARAARANPAELSARRGGSSCALTRRLRRCFKST